MFLNFLFQLIIFLIQLIIQLIQTIQKDIIDKLFFSFLKRNNFTKNFYLIVKKNCWKNIFFKL